MDGITSLIVCVLGLLVLAIVSIAIIYGAAYVIARIFYLFFSLTIFKWIDKWTDEKED